MLNLATKSWYCRYENQELASADLIVDLSHALCEAYSIECLNNHLQIILIETLTNAIDHGVLGLDSKIKDGVNGFDEYILERQQRLDELNNGWVSVNAELADNGVLQIVVEDSGNGFDFSEVYKNENVLCDYHLYGRGLLIVKNLCRSMMHLGNGNCIVVEYDLTPGSDELTSDQSGSSESNNQDEITETETV